MKALTPFTIGQSALVGILSQLCSMYIAGLEFLQQSCAHLFEKLASFTIMGTSYEHS